MVAPNTTAAPMARTVVFAPANRTPPTANPAADSSIGPARRRLVENATDTPAPTSRPTLVTVVSIPTPGSPRPSVSIASGTVRTPIAPVATAMAAAISTSNRGPRDRARISRPLTASTPSVHGRNRPIGCPATCVCTPSVSANATNNAPAATANTASAPVVASAAATMPADRGPDPLRQRRHRVRRRHLLGCVTQGRHERVMIGPAGRVGDRGDGRDRVHEHGGRIGEERDRGRGGRDRLRQIAETHHPLAPEPIPEGRRHRREHPGRDQQHDRDEPHLPGARRVRTRRPRSRPTSRVPPR